MCDNGKLTGVEITGTTEYFDDMLGLIVDQLATEQHSLEALLAVRVYSSNSRPRTLT